MKRMIAVCLIAATALVVDSIPAQQSISQHPGLAPYTPTRIEWLATVLQADLRTEAIADDGYLLQITYSDPETILIYVRYLPTVKREVMNVTIDGARRVIAITVRSYGWDSWVKVKEDIQMQRR
ncbi:hypothetical protein QF000_006482 [Paraburkholderia atlantica]|uniref:hypothetical protein n=1 Tax=Paraburkholderia atlantica TaxID=2654982 RepID=UPI003D1DA823